jgi:hypothetical protein
MRTNTLLLLIVFWVFLVMALSSCSPTVVVKWKCPPLSPAPLSAVDALVQTSRKDPSTASWVIDLDKHYQKCDIINGSGK